MRPLNRERLAAGLRRWAGRGVYFGTSSWKYPGWFDVIYEWDRYVWRGKFSKARFERDCLAEYARTFPAVSVDASYYQFFNKRTLEELAAQVPEEFQFGFKVSGDITLKQFPRVARLGKKAGQANPHFLDAALFREAVLERSEGIRSKVGLFMFEFSRFGPDEFERGAQFVAALDEFFSRLPRGWPYGVELRNRHWLRPEYFAVLAKHGVTHIFNAWTDMPPVQEQMALPESETNPSLLAARFLLREGRGFEDAVKMFSPYTGVKDPNPEARGAAIALALKILRSRIRNRALIFVNNRFEGNSPGTIEALVGELEEKFTE
jgi:uncharacterized protein YecE (DUF72 family)